MEMCLSTRVICWDVSCVVWFVNENKLLGMYSVQFSLSMEVSCWGCILCNLVCQWK